jgi:CubicO group peptidase (beta-lactamase class C family)
MIDSIKKVLQTHVDQDDFPGASFCLVLPLGEIQCDYVGYKQTSPHKEVLNVDEMYDVASLTKVISTTTIILKLIEEKKLSLDSKIKNILSNFKHDHINIFHLLTHSSGLPAGLKEAKTLSSKKQVKELIFDLELIYETGSKILYSDVGFILLGFVIETITNESLQVNLKSYVCSKLSMNDTTYHPSIERCAPTEYRNDPLFRGFLQGIVHDETAFAMGGESGHAGLFSTAKDIALFINSILNQEFVLNSSTIDMMFQSQITAVKDLNHSYSRSLGWDKPSIGGSAGDFMPFEDTILHTGFTGCHMWINRKHHIGFVLLSNDVHPSRDKKGIISIRNGLGNLIMSHHINNIHQ